MLGILLVDKPAGITSHDVVNEMRRRFGTRRVGHAGTLDPLATGVLVVAVGPATRFLQYLPLEPKEYVGRFAFGRTTTTYDREGEIVAEVDPPTDLAEALEVVLPTFRGLISQLPPMHSAIKVNGRPLYSYARQGQEIRRDPRTVHITTMEVQAIEGSVATIRVVCSGGTYVRSLANDVGEALGCGGHLDGLRRTRVGRFGLDDCLPLDAAGPSDLLSLRDALPPMPLLALDDDQTRLVRDGRAIETDSPPEGRLAALLEPSGAVFSVARVLGNVLQPECVIPAEALHEAV